MRRSRSLRSLSPRAPRPQALVRLALLVALLASVCLPAAAVDYALEPTYDPGASEGARKVWEIVLRPLDFVRLAASAPLWLVAWPVSLVTGGSDFAGEVTVELPFERTFQRPLGEL